MVQGSQGWETLEFVAQGLSLGFRAQDPQGYTVGLMCSRSKAFATGVSVTNLYLPSDHQFQLRALASRRVVALEPCP